MSKFDALVTKFEATKKQMIEEGKAVLFEEFKQVFINHPELTVIKWQQIIPYFNDGESCVFSVGDVYASNVSDPSRLSQWGDIDDEEDGEFVVGMFCSAKEKYNDIFELSRFISSEIGMEIVRLTFGEHAIVTVTPNGIDSEEYDEHD